MLLRPLACSRRRRLRAAVAVAVVVLFHLGATSDAGADGARPSNFESVIDSVTPEQDGVTVEIVGGDAFVEVTAEPGTEVLVPGYDGEPYLRIDADGSVWRNRRAPATYLNASRSGDVSNLPDSASSSAAPDWVRIGSDGTVAWHDHRVHWMLRTAPETRDGLVQPWMVPMTVDGQQVQVSGRLLHHPNTVPWPALVGLATAAVAAWRARSAGARLALLGGAAAVALASSVSWYLANPQGAEPTVLPLVLPAAALVAVLAAQWAPRRVIPAVVRQLVLPLAAVALLLGWFVHRVGVVWMPTLPTTLADPLERVVSTAVAGIAAGVAVAILLRPYAVDAADQGDSTSRSSDAQSSTPPRS